MTKSENKDAVEVHGCIVCGKTYNVLAVYSANGRLVDCTVTSPGGHCVPGEPRPLVACDSHTSEEIKSAHTRWKSRLDAEADEELKDQ